MHGATLLPLLTPLLLALALPFAHAQTVYDIPSSASCNGYTFSNSDLSTASYQALDDLNSGTTQGSGSYPHQYNDREGIPFPNCQSPFYEFPLFKGKSYNGGSPGADRVIVGSYDGQNVEFCGVITHDGASQKNGFVGCQSS